jgi:hypothetical protein
MTGSMDSLRGGGAGRALEPALAEVMEHHVMRVTEHFADAWPVVSGMCPHPPGRDLYAPEPDEAPPPARLIPDPDLRERMPQLFEAAPAPPGLSGMPPPTGTELVFVWLEESGGTVAVCHQPGRIGILNADVDEHCPVLDLFKNPVPVTPPGVEGRIIIVRGCCPRAGSNHARSRTTSPARPGQGASGRAGSTQADQPDSPCEPGEVIEIDRDDCVDAMHQHGGYYIRVMNLLAATVDVVQQGEQAVGYLAVFCEQAGSPAESTHIRERVCQI